MSIGADREQLLSRIRAAGRAGIPPSELLAALGGDEERLAEWLAEWEESGDAVLWARRWYALEHTGWKVGTVAGIRGRSVVVEVSGEGSRQVPRARSQGAAKGDRVLLRPTRGGRGGASVVRVLRRRHRFLVGRIDEEGALEPLFAEASGPIRLGGTEEAVAGELVRVEIVRQRGEGGRAEAEIVERLGREGDPGIQSRVVIAALELPEIFPDAVREEAEAIASVSVDGSSAPRQDLRTLPAVTIDGASARDFDDALSLVEGPEGRFHLGIHIADVSHYVPPGGAIDREARERGCSVYLPDRVLPMLPSRLSEDLCSLVPHEPRAALSLLLEITPRGEVVGERWTESLIESRRRLTYVEVEGLLERREPEEDDRELAGMLRSMASLAEGLRELRRRRGALELDLRERVLDEDDGEVVEVRFRDRMRAERIVEELMILANERTAQLLHELGRPTIFRTHAPPEEPLLEELAPRLEALGLRSVRRPEEIPRLLGEAGEGPFGEIVSGWILRVLPRALYRATCDPHFGLASTAYLHFTSPIRRYPDLTVHRRIKDWLAGRPSPTAEEDGLEATARLASRREERADRAERAVRGWRVLSHLAARRGEIFDGVVTELRRSGATVRLVAVGVSGFVPAHFLGPPPCFAIEGATVLIGRGRARLARIGDRIPMRIEVIDPPTGGLILRPAELGEGSEGLLSGEEASRSRRGADRRRHRRPRRSQPI